MRSTAVLQRQHGSAAAAGQQTQYSSGSGRPGSSGVDRVPARAYQRLHWEINRQDDRSIGMKKKEREYKQPAEIASSAATARLDCADCTAAVSLLAHFLSCLRTREHDYRRIVIIIGIVHKQKCYVVRAFQKWQFRWRLKASTVGVTILFSVATFTSSRN